MMKYNFTYTVASVVAQKLSAFKCISIIFISLLYSLFVSTKIAILNGKTQLSVIVQLFLGLCCRIHKTLPLPAE